MSDSQSCCRSMGDKRQRERAEGRPSARGKAEREYGGRVRRRSARQDLRCERALYAKCKMINQLADRRIAHEECRLTMFGICVALVQQSERGAARVIGHRCALEENNGDYVKHEGAGHHEERQAGPKTSLVLVPPILPTKIKRSS